MSDIPKEQKGLFYSKYGGADVVELGTIPVPPMEEDDVMVRVHAASLNPIDFKRRNGDLKAVAPERSWPVVMGYDVSGEVVAVGAGANAQRFSVGDAVFARVEDRRTGTVAQYVAVAATLCALKPAKLSHEEAASVPLVGLTTLQAFRLGGVEAGKRVFLTAGAGGIGTCALQYARNVLGCAAVVTTASAGEKTALCQELGATEVVDYRSERFADRLAADFDFALDATHEARDCVRVLAPGSNAVAVSIAGPPTADGLQRTGRHSLGLPVRLYLWAVSRSVVNAAAAKGCRYEFLLLRTNGDDLAELAAHYQAGKIKAVIDQTFSLDDAAKALERIESGRAKGKVVIKVI